MLKTPIKKTRIYRDTIRIRRFSKRIDIKLRQMIAPGLLAFFASIFEGISFALLIPTIKGIFGGDFGFVTKTPVLSQAIDLFLPFLGRRNATIFMLLVIFIFAAVVLKNIFQYASSVTTFSLVRHVSNNMRKRIYERYLSFGKLFFDQTSAGHIYQVLIGFTQTIAVEIRVLERAFYMFFTLIVYLVIMAYISWQLLFFVIMIFPFFHYSVTWLIRKIKKSSRNFAEAHSEMSKKISSALSCIQLIKAYKDEKRAGEWFSYASERVKNFQFSIDKKQALITPLQEIIFLCLTLMLVGAIAFLFVREKAGDVAGYVVFLVLLRRSNSSFGLFNNMRSSFASLRGPISEVAKVFNDSDKYFVPDGTREFKGINKSIEIKQVDFSYPEGVQALSGITFSIEKGKTTAIVGSSGGGKTTIINMIMRFFDASSGSIMIDGVDLRDFTLSSLRSKIALVSQEVFLFNESLRFNIGYGLKDGLSDVEILKAAERAQLYDFITNLPKGLDAEVGDRGVQLSGGEKQRVSIARAILKNADIIILDEATSSLDSITEKSIQKALEELIKGKTTVVITHRFSTIKSADKIIVIESGRVLEQGSLKQLLGQKGKFYQYWQEQMFY